MCRWREEHPELEGKFVVTLPARIARRRGQEDLIAVIARLKQAGLRAHGLLAGEVEPRQRSFLREFKDALSAQGLTADVTLLERRQDLREVLAVSDAVVSLTREPEAFGRATIEALALGVPVVGYDHGGTAEILRAVFPAGLVPRGDTSAAAARLIQFSAQRPSVPSDNPFTLSRMLNATFRLYEDVIEAGHAPPGNANERAGVG